MKKLLTLLGSFGIVATAPIMAVSCGTDQKDSKEIKSEDLKINIVTDMNGKFHKASDVNTFINDKTTSGKAKNAAFLKLLSDNHVSLSGAAKGTDGKEITLTFTALEGYTIKGDSTFDIYTVGNIPSEIN